jgi:hypothetical protein
MADALLNGGDDGDGNIIFVYTGGRAPHDVRRVRICESIDTIPAYAFKDCQLIEVEGHKKLKKIEEGAFFRCRRLRRLMKMNGVEEIERDAFLGCHVLSDLEFGKLVIIGGGAFFNCRSLRSISMPSVRKIGASAFYGCTALTEAAFGEDLERIAVFAFNDCPSLRRIAIPLKDGLIIEDGAINYCDNLSSVDVIGGIHKTISSLHMQSWRDEMKGKIDRINQSLPDTQSAAKGAAIQQWVESVHPKMEHYKVEHRLLVKEASTLLELALWKANLDENEVNGITSPEGVRVTRRQVKRARKERCITSGAGIIIKNVLPFLQLS